MSSILNYMYSELLSVDKNKDILVQSSAKEQEQDINRDLNKKIRRIERNILKLEKEWKNISASIKLEYRNQNCDSIKMKTLLDRARSCNSLRTTLQLQLSTAEKQKSYVSKVSNDFSDCNTVRDITSLIGKINKTNEKNINMSNVGNKFEREKVRMEILNDKIETINDDITEASYGDYTDETEKNFMALLEKETGLELKTKLPSMHNLDANIDEEYINLLKKINVPTNAL